MNSNLLTHLSFTSMKRTFLITSLLLQVLIVQAAFEVTDMKVSGLTSPVGIDQQTPTFSWKIKSEERGFRQTGYQVVVTNGEGTEVWNSGPVNSALQNNVEYEGSPLQSRTEYHWSVTVFSEDKGQETGESRFETAFMSPSEWTAQWIEADLAEPTGAAVVTLPEPIACRYVRIDVTRLGIPAANDPNFYFLQLAEVEIFSGDTNVARTANFTASESWEQYAQWNIKFINDGIIQGDNAHMGYTSTQKSSNNQHIYLTADLGSSQSIDRIVLYPRQDVAAKTNKQLAANFPSSYTLQTSDDNKTYTTQYKVTNGEMPTFTAGATGNVPYFGRSFTLPDHKQVKRARIYASALGVFNMKLNGQPVTENRLEPGESEFGKSVLYSTYDVTPLLQSGKNALLAQVAGGIFNVTPVNGRYSKGEIQNSGNTSLLAELFIEYTDGSTDHIITDKNWRCALSPTTGSNWWGGEDYDARLYNASVERSDFDFAGWKPVQEVTPSFRYSHVNKNYSCPGTLKARTYEPLRIVETWKAVNIRKMSNGDYMVDFGRNYAGTYRFTLKGKKGQTIRLREFERLDGNGNGYIDNWYTGTSVVYEEYTFGQDDTEETWGPEFMYHGFRYMQISGLSEAPSPSDFTAQRIRSNMDQTGYFSTSNTLINDIHTLCRDAIQSQLYNTITDCPQREKLGWLDVPNEMFNSLCYNYDMTTFWTKVVMDCFDAQGENGFVPSTAPWFMNVYADDPNWGGTGILVPYRSLKTYGDRSLMKKYYPQMKRLMDYYTSRTTDYIMQNYSVLSDWGQSSCGLAVQTPTEFTITTTYYHLLQAMAEMAEEMNYQADATRYTELAANVKKAFNKRFFKSGNVYNNGNQAEYGMALYYGLVEAENEAAVAAKLAEKVIADQYRIRTGEIGLKPMLMSLAKYGYNEIVYRMANQTDYPSYGFFVKSGCTTTPEYWDMNRADNSQNHCMMDHIEEWFFSELGGIRNTGTAFNEMELSPWIPADMSSMDISSQTVYGTVRSAWHKTSSGGFRYEFNVPEGTTATIKVPLADTGEALLENGREIKAGENGVTDVTYTDSLAIVKIGSGSYVFTTGDVDNDDRAMIENFWIPVHHTDQLPAGAEIKIQETVHSGHSGRFLGWCAAHGLANGEFVTGAPHTHAVNLTIESPAMAQVDGKESYGVLLRSAESSLYLNSLNDGGKMLSWNNTGRRWGLDITEDGTCTFYRQTDGGRRNGNYVFFFDNGANAGINAFGTTAGNNLWKIYRKYNVSASAANRLQQAALGTDSLFYTRLVSRSGRCEGICLLFSISEARMPRDFSFYRFTNTETQTDGTVKLLATRVKQTEAGIPYLIRYTGSHPSETDMEVELHGLVEIQTPKSEQHVNGCFSSQTASAEKCFYMLNPNGDAFLPADAETATSVFRIYMQQDIASAAERYDIIFEETPDNIKTVTDKSCKPHITGIYNIEGKQFCHPHEIPQALHPGIYIVNGKKVLVK